MLNRRALRIKAMQAVYAYQQSKQSDFNLAINHIIEELQPDLLAAEPEDMELLKVYQKGAINIFKSDFQNGRISFPEDTPKRAKDAVINAVAHFRGLVQKDVEHHRKELIVETQKIFQSYLKSLNLIIEFANAADEELKRKQKVYFEKPIDAGQFNLVENRYIKAFQADENFTNVLLRNHADWNQDSEMVWQWYKDALKKNSSYLEYITKSKPSAEDDKAILWAIAREVIFKYDGIKSYFESYELNWSEDKEIVKSMVKKTIKDLDLESEQIEVMELSTNWEEDDIFLRTLFDECVENEQEYEKYFEHLLKNWEVERTAMMDRIIISMAIAEMLNFPGIPVKVTINEYIEISKLYSTPKSKQFINGVLDAVGNELKEKGILKKSGRGLIDNK